GLVERASRRGWALDCLQQNKHAKYCDARKNNTQHRAILLATCNSRGDRRGAARVGRRAGRVARRHPVRESRYYLAIDQNFEAEGRIRAPTIQGESRRTGTDEGFVPVGEHVLLALLLDWRQATGPLPPTHDGEGEIANR